jgi:hypothetical protein
MRRESLAGIRKDDDGGVKDRDGLREAGGLAAPDGKIEHAGAGEASLGAGGIGRAIGADGDLERERRREEVLDAGADARLLIVRHDDDGNPFGICRPRAAMRIW